MKTIVYSNRERLYSDVLKHLIAVIRDLPSFNLGLATGSSPERLYALMIEAYKEKAFEPHKIKTFNLDEYVGLDATHVASYRYYMNDKLFKHIPFKEVHVPQGMGDLDLNTKYYNELLSKHPIDLQVLGIGSNGHIAFNEPGTAFDSVTHIVSLTQQTISDNARFFNSINEVPKQAITMGLKNIMDAKEIILIALGENKAQAIYDMIHGPITEGMPASILQKHPKVTIYLDREASTLL